MKRTFLALWMVTICAACVAQEKVGTTLEAYSKRRTQPILVAPAYRFEEGKMPTVSFYELDSSPLAALTLKRDRYLVFTEDQDFARKVTWHFQSMRDPRSWTGSTMYAASMTSLFGASAPTVKLEIVHFDALGRLVGERQIRIHIAYFESGAEGRLIRRPTAR